MNSFVDSISSLWRGRKPECTDVTSAEHRLEPDKKTAAEVLSSRVRCAGLKSLAQMEALA